MLKSINCGDLRREHVGQTVTLAGWVHRRRDHGALIFIDLRDRSGIVQVTCDKESNPEAHAVLNGVRAEYVVQVTGTVQARPEGLANPNIPTGEVEVVATSAAVLNEARTTPFYINEDVELDEALRLKYRYLDLRRPAMQKNIILRHQVVNLIRTFMNEHAFLEIETPILIKTTPEGARDYVVPSRVHPGKFYALPQSPQQLKQLLMVAGYERYFQIARCFRDEDLRADRQPEFTQLDVEMSFIERADIISLISELYTQIIEQLGSKPIQQKPFPVLTYAEAMDKYGSDKPDLRFGMEHVDLSDLVANSSFGVFSGAIAGGGKVKGIVAPGCAGYSRKELDDLAEVAKRAGAKGLVHIAYREDGPKSSAAKFLHESDFNALAERLGREHGRPCADRRRPGSDGRGQGAWRVAGAAGPAAGPRAEGRSRTVLGRGVPSARVERRGAALDRHASSVYVRDGRGLGPAGHRSRQGARKGLRHRDGRLGSRWRVDPDPPAAPAVSNVQGAGDRVGGG